MNINLQNTNLEMSAGRRDQFPKRDVCHIVFSGRSNVGKSSLINTLLGRNKLARVSSTPGKTITINFYNIDNKLYFVDLPGYGFAKRPPNEKLQWSTLVDDYFGAMSEKGDKLLVIQLVDMKVGVTKDDAMMLDWMNKAGVNYIVVATKSDKLNKTEFDKSAYKLANCPDIEEDTDIIPFSSLKGTGKNEVLSLIYDFAEL